MTTNDTAARERPRGMRAELTALADELADTAPDVAHRIRSILHIDGGFRRATPAEPEIPADRREFVDAIRSQAWDIGRPCTACGGDGSVRPGRRIVHCVGSFIGADWDESDVIDAVLKAREVRWADFPAWLTDGDTDRTGRNLDGWHQLQVTAHDGKAWRFQVRQEASDVRS